MPVFRKIFARDPANPNDIASNATITLFDPADPNKTPVALTKLDGTALANPYTVNRQGEGPAFQHETLYIVGWEGGGHSGEFDSIESMHADTLAARTAAENSVLLAQDAQAAATNAGATAATEAAAAAKIETEAALAAANAAIDASAQAAQDAAALVDAPAGTVVRSTIEADLDTPGSGIATRISSTIAGEVETSDYLPVAYAPAAAGSLGNGFVALGDSITAGGDSFINGLARQANSWPAFAGWATKQRLHLIRNAGIGGNTSAQMLARFDTDVTPYKPRIVSIGAGTNDMGQDVPFATFKANMAALVGKVRAIGAVPVLVTIPPRNDTATYGVRVATWNVWLRRYALLEGMTLVDFGGLLTDPANGQMLAAYGSGDGIHPSAAGYAAMGDLFTKQVESLTKRWAPPFPVSETDPTNLLNPGGLFLADAGFGQATGWTTLGGSANRTPSLVADPNIKGNWQQLVITAGTGVGITRSVTTGFAAGDRILFCGRFSTTGGNFQARLLFTGTADLLQPVLVDGPLADGAFSMEGTVPAGTTALSPRLYGNVGTQKIAQVGIYNLTALGLA